MRTTSILLAAALLASGCRQADRQQVQVTDAFITRPAIEGRPGAAYFTLQTDRPDVSLTRVTSPHIGRIELHETMQSGGMHRMMATGPVPVGIEPVRFEPGGRHAMLFDMEGHLAVGSYVPLTFQFEGAPETTVHAEVRAPGDVAR